VFRILPNRKRAEARAEGPCGNRALLEKPWSSPVPSHPLLQLPAPVHDYHQSRLGLLRQAEVPNHEKAFTVRMDVVLGEVRKKVVVVPRKKDSATP